MSVPYGGSYSERFEFRFLNLPPRDSDCSRYPGGAVRVVWPLLLEWRTIESRVEDYIKRSAEVIIYRCEVSPF